MPYNDAFRGLMQAVPGSALMSSGEQSLDPRTAPIGDVEGALYSYKKRLKDELQTRLFNTMRAGDPREAAALKGLLGETEQDIEASPLTREMGNVEAIEAARSKAATAGFASPQEQAQYGREMEAEKLRSPLEQVKVQQAGELAKQQEASKGALAVAESKGGQQENFMNALLQLRAGGVDVSHISAPGGGGVTFNQPKPVPPQLQTQLSTAREAAGRAGESKFFGLGGPTPEKLKVDQLTAEIIGAHPADYKIKDVARKILATPQAAQAPFAQIATRVQQLNPALTPEDLSQLRDLIGILRGKDF